MLMNLLGFEWMRSGRSPQLIYPLDA